MPLSPNDRPHALTDQRHPVIDRTRRTARTAAAVGGALVLVLTVGACGPANAGSSAASAFEDWMSAYPDVAEVYASGTNDLPFSGTAAGVVTLVPDLSPDEVAAVVERAVTFESRTSVSVSIDYPAGDFLASYPVSSTDRAHNAELDAFVRALDAGTSATTVELEVGLDDTGVVAEGPGDFLAGFDEVRAVAADHAAMPVGTEFTSTDSGFTVSAGVGGDAHAARAVYTAVAAAYPLIGAVLADDAVSLRVDVPRTPDVATLASTVAGAIPVSVQFENVTRVGDGDFTASELVTATARGAATVLTVQERSSWVEVVVTDLESALSVAAAVHALPPTGAALTLRTEDGRFVLYQLGRGNGYGEYARTLTALDALGAAVKEVDVSGERLDVELTDDADLAVVGAALTLAPRSCPALTVTVVSEYRLELAPARPLTAADVTVGWGEPVPTDAIDALIDGWNAGE